MAATCTRIPTRVPCGPTLDPQLGQRRCSLNAKPKRPTRPCHTGCSAHGRSREPGCRSRGTPAAHVRRSAAALRARDRSRPVGGRTPGAPPAPGRAPRPAACAAASVWLRVRPHASSRVAGETVIRGSGVRWSILSSLERCATAPPLAVAGAAVKACRDNPSRHSPAPLGAVQAATGGTREALATLGPAPWAGNGRGEQRQHRKGHGTVGAAGGALRLNPAFAVVR